MTAKPNARLQGAIRDIAPHLHLLLALRPQLAGAVHVLLEASHRQPGRPRLNHDLEVLAMLAHERRTGITAPKTLARLVLNGMGPMPSSRAGDQSVRLGDRLVSVDSALKILVMHFQRRAPALRQALHEADAARVRTEALLACGGGVQITPARSASPGLRTVLMAARRVTPPTDPAAFLVKVDGYRQGALDALRRRKKPGS